MASVFCVWFEKIIILGNTNCGAYKVNRILNSYYKDEIPIFGSSRAETGIVPDILGDNYFNYGVNGTQDDVLLFFLKEECKKRDKSRPYIIVNMDVDGINYRSADLLNYIYNSNNPGVKELVPRLNEPYFTNGILK